MMVVMWCWRGGLRLRLRLGRGSGDGGWVVWEVVEPLLGDGALDYLLG